MTVKSTLAAIRAIGLTAGYKNGEFRVSYLLAAMPDAKRREACAYYTTDATDALETARSMARDRIALRQSLFEVPAATGPAEGFAAEEPDVSKMVLYHEATGMPAMIGDALTDFRGEKAVLESMERPRHAGSTGRANGFYPSVFNLVWR